MSTLYKMFVTAKLEIEAADNSEKFALMRVWGPKLEKESTGSDKDLDIIEQYLIYCIGVRRRILEEEL